MASGYKIARPSIQVPIAAAGTTGNLVVSDINANGLLRGVIIKPGLFDSAVVAVSDSVTTTERVDVARAATRDLATSDTVTTTENVKAAEA